MKSFNEKKKYKAGSFEKMTETYMVSYIMNMYMSFFHSVFFPKIIRKIIIKEKNPLN